MRSSVFLAALLLGLASSALAAQWVVIIAGSFSYGNYRHQADAYAAYQIMHANGIPDDHIIVAHHDDIANDPSNPKPGQVFNWPNGPNVYVNVPKDIVGDQLTVANIIKLLSGEDMKGTGSGKTLAPTADDTVFITFHDHGTTGAVAIGDDLLYATDIWNALSKLQYKQLVFYVEACESGSVAIGAPKSLQNVYWLTASNPTTSSYACDYDDTLQTYMNDCFSYQWMQSVRNHQSSASFTFEDNFNELQPLVTQSNACQYGDADLEAETMSSFIGVKPGRFSLLNSASGMAPRADSADTRMAALKIIEKRLAKATGAEKVRLEAERSEHFHAAARVAEIFAAVDAKFPSTFKLAQKLKNPDDPSCSQQVARNLECLKATQQAYVTMCGLNDYAMMEFHRLAEHCDVGVSAQSIINVLAKACAQ